MPVRLGRAIQVEIIDTVTLRRRRSPQFTLVMGFLAMTLVAAALLALPFASADGTATPLWDALFTATSAVATCGLVVVDTGTHWSQFGRIVILLAMQAGGLGFMAGTIILFQALGRQVSRHQRQTLQEQLALRFFGGMSRTARYFVAYTLVLELIGWVLLSWQFANSDGPGSADPVFYGLFHAVSAFTGSGFDLMGGYSSMAGFAATPVFLVIMMALIIPGDLGFLAVFDGLRSRSWPYALEWRFKRAETGLVNFAARAAWRLNTGARWLRARFGRRAESLSPPEPERAPTHPRRPPNMRMETKLILAGNAICWPLAAVGFLILEWGNPDTLGALSAIDRVFNSAFHAVTSRNAGFSTVSVGMLNELTLILLVPFMIIGTASASMGAGLKINTVGVLFATAMSRLRGLRQTEIFGRSIPVDRVYVSVTLLVLFLAMELITLLVVHATYSNPEMINSLFDSVSAVSDIGLSTGVPSQLNPGGKFFMCLIMFIARLGPLTIVLALLSPRMVGVGVRRPAESLRVG